MERKVRIEKEGTSQQNAALQEGSTSQLIFTRLAELETSRNQYLCCFQRHTLVNTHFHYGKQFLRNHRCVKCIVPMLVLVYKA